MNYIERALIIAIALVAVHIGYSQLRPALDLHMCRVRATLENSGAPCVVRVPSR